MKGLIMDMARKLASYSDILGAEQVRILLILEARKCIYLESIPYDSRGMLKMAIHHAVHPWTNGNDKKRWNRAWADGLDEMQRQKLVYCVSNMEENVWCIGQKGITTLDKLRSLYQEGNKQKVKTKGVK